tara:strand:- start:274 stop:627 length:354 start_codon:yes stop_codon:yes gene_type:complete
MGPEATEQKAVVGRLRRAKTVFCAVPNERANKIQAIHFKAMGVEAGAPDLLIFDPPPAVWGAAGTALEMKCMGGRPSDVSETQRAFHKRLEALGWHVIVGYGSQDALVKLRRAGYNL